mmetsp:Transcript_3403/g.11803  ORF Transcript_3403/g.11803 Transcript_3403/m.11803 type:complete len:227 (-) Transcript_3403:78-758(-)
MVFLTTHVCDSRTGSRVRRETVRTLSRALAYVHECKPHGKATHRYTIIQNLRSLVSVPHPQSRCDIDNQATARARHTCACATLSAAVMCQATLSRRPLGLAAPLPRTSTNKSSPRRSLPALATSVRPGGVIGPSHGCHDTPRKPAPHRLFGTRTGSHPSGRTTGTAVARKRSSRRSSRATSAGLSAARSWYSQASAVTLKRQYSSAHCPASAAPTRRERSHRSPTA